MIDTRRNVRKDYRYNGSGYYDPTPHKAIKRIEEREKLARKVILTVQNVAHLAGFDIVGRLELRDKESRRIYR